MFIGLRIGYSNRGPLSGGRVGARFDVTAADATMVARVTNNAARFAVTADNATMVSRVVNNAARFAVTSANATMVAAAGVAQGVSVAVTAANATVTARSANNAARFAVTAANATMVASVDNAASDPESLVFTGSQALQAPGTMNEPGPFTVCFWVLATDWVEFLFGRIWTLHAGGTDHVQIRLRWTGSDDPNNNLRFVGQAGFDEGANAYMDSSDAEDWVHCFVKCTSGGDLTFGWRKQGEGSYTTATAAGSYYQDSTEMWVGAYDESAGWITGEIAQAIGWNRLVDEADIYDQSLQVAIIDSTSIVFDLECNHTNAGNNRAGTDWTVNGTFSTTGTGPAELVP